MIHIVKHFNEGSMSISKKLLVLCALTTITGQAAMASDIPRVKWMDRMFYTVNKEAKLDAPVWINTEEKRNEYGSIYMKKLIKSAHNIAKDYLKYNDYEAYNSFMILALTFPLHEGLYMSYRETFDEKGLCNDDANSGRIMFKESRQKIFEHVQAHLEEIINDNAQKSQLEQLKSVDKANYEKFRDILVDDYTNILLAEKMDSIANTDKPSNYRNFVKYLKDSSNPFVLECENVKNDDHIRQLIRGGDGTDIGPVQLSLRWHFDEFIAKRKYLSLSDTFDYGLNFIHDGFKKLYYDGQDSKNKTYSCIQETINKKTHVNLSKLVRATWSGKYNQGQIAKSCRIADVDGSDEIDSQISSLKTKEKVTVSKSKKLSILKQITALEDKQKAFKKHPDYHFKNNLKKVQEFKDKELLGYIDNISFKTDAATKKAINDIVTNFNDGKADGKNLKNIEALVK